MTDRLAGRAGTGGSTRPGRPGPAAGRGRHVDLPAGPASLLIVPRGKPLPRPKRARRPAGLAGVEAQAWAMSEYPELSGKVAEILAKPAIAARVWSYHAWTSIHSQPGWLDVFMFGPPPRFKIMIRELKAMGYPPTYEQDFVMRAWAANGHGVGMWTRLDLLQGTIGAEIGALANTGRNPR